MAYQFLNVYTVLTKLSKYKNYIYICIYIYSLRRLGRFWRFVSNRNITCWETYVLFLINYRKRSNFLVFFSVHFYINSTGVIRPVRQNKLSFSSIETKKPLPVLVPAVCRSDSSLKANSSCCHRSDRSDDWSLLE